MNSIPIGDFDAAVACLEAQGYVLFDKVLDEEKTSHFTRVVMQAPRRAVTENYETTEGLLDTAPELAELITHPEILEIVRFLIGGRSEAADNAFAWPKEDRVRVFCVDALISHPGSQKQYWHCDPPAHQSVRQGQPLPDFPTSVNVLWILTPFSKTTGATRVLPGSHRLREMPPATPDDLDGEISLTADPGSVAILPNTIWHAAGTNQSDRERVMVSCAYNPWWIGRLSPDNDPISRQTWERLPPAAKQLTEHQLYWKPSSERTAYPWQEKEDAS